MRILLGFALIYFITFILIFRKLKSDKVLSLTLWMFFSWIILITVHLFSGITYAYKLDYKILFFVLVCLLAIAMGEKVGLKVVFSKKRIVLKRLFNRNQISIKLLSIIALFGAGFLLFDMITLNEIVLGKRIENMQISVLGVIGNILINLGLVAWLIAFYQFLIRKQKINIWAIIGLISYFLYAIMTAGRQSIFIALVSSLLVYLQCIKLNTGHRSIKNKLINTTKKIGTNFFGKTILACLCAMLVFYIVIIPNYRTGLSGESNIAYMDYISNSKTSTEVIDISNRLGPFSEMYTQFLFYYSHELIFLDVYYKNYDQPPLLGFGQFNYITRRFYWLIGDRYEKMNETNYRIMYAQGMSPSGWGTFLAIFIADYGRIGSIIMCFVFGILAGKSRRGVLLKPTAINVARQSMICVGGVFSIQYSPFSEMSWAFTLFWILILSLFVSSPNQNITGESEKR